MTTALLVTILKGKIVSRKVGHKVLYYKTNINVRTSKLCTVCGSRYLGTKVQVTCSLECRAVKSKRSQEVFRNKYPEATKRYNDNRIKKNPNVWKEKTKNERAIIVGTLGGKCVVETCKVTNPLWLHVDYIPTMIGTGYRHPRHLAWVLEHISDFRLLCANHHYELTLTGKIHGTTITQKSRNNRTNT